MAMHLRTYAICYGLVSTIRNKIETKKDFFQRKYKSALIQWSKTSKGDKYVSMKKEKIVTLKSPEYYAHSK